MKNRLNELFHDLDSKSDPKKILESNESLKKKEENTIAIDDKNENLFSKKSPVFTELDVNITQESFQTEDHKNKAENFSENRKIRNISSKNNKVNLFIIKKCLLYIGKTSKSYKYRMAKFILYGLIKNK